MAVTSTSTRAVLGVRAAIWTSVLAGPDLAKRLGMGVCDERGVGHVHDVHDGADDMVQGSPGLE